MTDADIATHIAALGDLAFGARHELTRVFVRVDEEGATVAATDGHSLVMVCSPRVDEDVEPCDGWVPAAVAKAMWSTNVEAWAASWRRILIEDTNADDVVTLESIFKVLPRPNNSRMPMPLTLGPAVHAVAAALERLDAAQMHWQPGESSACIRIDSTIKDYDDGTLSYVVCGLMPAKGDA